MDGQIVDTGGPEPARTSPGSALSKKTSTLARRATAPELALRRELHRRGLRFRVQLRAPGNGRRAIDIAFTRARLAIYVDGCFWHGCPQHHQRPKANSEWWDWKIAKNRERGRSTNDQLRDAGWDVLRVWEHEKPAAAADLVIERYRTQIAQRH